ncbi:CDP-glucose 4,6-dehydratase [Paenibacillus solisilvae]|uniref:CDP-glucose 4,6-dehydratase n=1 Tax=Paenibacillus solisilvae TaxID=2486751 RepID=A0ABW0VZY6_9BACL
MNHSFWQSKKVFITGHTGFNGSWLCLWLRRLGAEIHGYSDKLPTSPSMYRLCGLEQDIAWTRGDIRDGGRLTEALRIVKPDIIFHLAAQPLLGRSYEDPLTTFAVNTVGTAALLDAVRVTGSDHPVRAVVLATSDHCYANRESKMGCREYDAIGGQDPFSASKACAELVVSAYRRSFFEGGSGMPAVATVQAGSIIGGGDWAEGRIVPGCVRAAMLGHAPVLQSPETVRPWQHVLEPLAGYLELAERLFGKGGASYAEAWNFGPREEDAKADSWLAGAFCSALGIQTSACTGAAAQEAENIGSRKVTAVLRLDSTKAQYRLGWRPCWKADEAVNRTAEWYLQWMKGMPMRDVSAAQIADYEAAAGNNSKEHELAGEGADSMLAFTEESKSGGV